MSLDKLFNPTSVAIVGVSKEKHKVGHLVAKNMLDQGYRGGLYFVHPTEKTILGAPVYPRLEDIKKKIDLVIFATPASVTINLLESVYNVGVRHVIIFAAGFKETHTRESDQLEADLLKKIGKYKLKILGPNCIGFVNTGRAINATFLKLPAPVGNVGIISQSGALGSALEDYFAAHTNLGFSYFISLGNKSSLDESDCLTFLAGDPKTKVIGMYLEDVVDGDKFHKALTAASRQKPIVILKGGSTQAGSQAAISHTGSMVGDDQVFEAVVSQTGAIRVHSYALFQQLLMLYSFNRIPSSRRILVLSNAGGMGVLLTDEIVKENLELITISEKTKKKLYSAFGEIKKITVHNPIDLLGDASAFHYEKAITLTQKEQNFGATVILLTPQANTEIMETANVIAKAQRKLDRAHKSRRNPIYPVFMGGHSIHKANTFFETQTMKYFKTFDDLPKILSSICDRRDRLTTLASNSKQVDHMSLAAHDLDIRTLLLSNQNKKFLNQYDSLKLLSHTGLATAQTYHVVSERDLKAVLTKEGYPLVAKIASEKITHKTEVQGVITGLNTWEELVDAYSHLTQITGKQSGCYIQKEYRGYELIVGAKRDLTFGPVILVGMGGIYAELLKEAVQFVYPFSFEYFKYILLRTKLNAFIKGYRNKPSLDISNLYLVAERLGALMITYTQIKEVDINPLIADGKKMMIVDARIVI